jgi:hypothetical protein
VNAKEFKTWRERIGLTQQQIAERLGITRTTIQNWEGGATPIPQAVDMSCEIWEARLKQENPDLGPVTLIYSDGPMFVNPYGPRSRPAMMQQEPYPTNTAALARVQQLWGRDNFHNPFIIEKSGTPLWNVVELGRVVDGDDTGAPTLVNLLRAIAKNVRANSTIFVRSGPKMLTPAEAKKRQQAIEGQADELDRFAGSGIRAIIRDQLLVEGVFSKLLALGTRAPDSLVSNVAQALVVFEQNQTSEVHFYSLKRATPNFTSGDKDEWSIPGALSPDEALRYFEKDLGFGLRRIDDDDDNGEFVLEQRERITTQRGAALSIQPGKAITTSWVGRVRVKA